MAEGYFIREIYTARWQWGVGERSESCDQACRLIKACVKTRKMSNNEKQTELKQSTSWKGLNDI